ncbi:MAG: ribokinase [Halanaerobiaceae bacterium]
MNNVLVVGSLNMDITAKAEQLPEVGETVLGYELIKNPGGKGANQAVSVSKLGGTSWILGKIGDDQHGILLKESLLNCEVNIDYLSIDTGCQTGCAVINVDRQGNNTIIVIPGANHELKESDLRQVDDEISRFDSALLQLEVPLDTVFSAVEWLNKEGVRVIVDPVPVAEIPEDLFAKIDIMTPNLKEAKQLLKVEKKDISIPEVAELLINKGINIVILTLGEKGAYVRSNSGNEFLIEGLEVNSVDSTGAGDCFTGAFAAHYDGTNLRKAVEFANTAAALATTRIGAQQAVPANEEVREFQKENKTFAG